MGKKKKVKKEWQEYEELVHSKIELEFSGHEIVYNDKIRGRYSKYQRQVDISINAKFGNDVRLIAVECKYHSKNLDVTYVERFLAFLDDIGAHSGILVTDKGFSKAAKNRAENFLGREITLDIVKLADLKDYFYNWNYCYFCHDHHGVFIRTDNIQMEYFYEVPEEVLEVCEFKSCMRCESWQYKCKDCGSVMDNDFNEEVYQCSCGDKIRVVLSFDGDGVEEYNFELIDNPDEDFTNPNQLTLFD